MIITAYQVWIFLPRSDKSNLDPSF